MPANTDANSKSRVKSGSLIVSLAERVEEICPAVLNEIRVPEDGDRERFAGSLGHRIATLKLAICSLPAVD